MPLNYNAIRRIARDIHLDAQFATNLAYGDPAIIHKLFKEFIDEGASVNFDVVDTYDTERRQFYKAHIDATLDVIMDTIRKEYPDAV